MVAPAFEIGNQNLVSRSVSIPAGETIRILDINVDIQQGWQMVYQFTADSQAGNLNLKTTTNLSDFTQQFDWGAATGDFITGKGSFRVEVTNFAIAPAPASTINTYVTTENFIDSVGSFTELRQSGGVIGVFQDAGTFGGFVPFPFNAFSILTSDPIDIRFVDHSGALVDAIYLGVPQRDRLLFQTMMPKQLRLQVAGTIINQPFTVQWTRV